MMIVWLELWPGGDASRAHPLGAARITNDESGDLSVSNYDVALYKFETEERAQLDDRHVWRRGRVIGFPRRGGLGPWYLLLRALVATLGGTR